MIECGSYRIKSTEGLKNGTVRWLMVAEIDGATHSFSMDVPGSVHMGWLAAVTQGNAFGFEVTSASIIKLDRVPAVDLD